MQAPKRDPGEVCTFMCPTDWQSERALGTDTLSLSAGCHCCVYGGDKKLCP